MCARSCVANPGKRFPSLRIALIAMLTLLLCGWTTCTAIVNFSSCPGTVPQPQITALSPDTIPADSQSVLLIVSGSDFVPQSHIMWNGNPLQTSFVDSHHLQATITQQTFDSFGGSAGSSVQISATSQGFTPALGCPLARNSATLVLVIY
jgi:hypothetical protein